MKKPLLLAKELEILNTLCAENLSLIPKLIDINGFKIKKIPRISVTEISSFCKNRLFARVIEMKLLTGADSIKPTYALDFRVNDINKEFLYQPGDSFGFYPELSNEEVVNLATRLEVSLEDLIEISGPSNILTELLPSYEDNLKGILVIKIRDLLCRLDFRGFPKKAVLRTLAEFCQKPEEALVLLFLSSRSGSDAYNRLRSEMLSVQVLFSALDSLKPPLEALVSILGPMQPRFYSCCRMQKNNQKNNFQIVFNVSEMAPESAPDMKIKGVASSWLESLGNTINQDHNILLPIIQRSITHFRLPEIINERPIIMIGAGTGVAPFIGFLECLQQAKSTDLNPFSWLIFGLRNLKDDFIFQEELKEFESEKTLSKLSFAVSRDPLQPKTYVQDIIRAESKEFFKLLCVDDAIIYICGDELTMIKGVNEAIIEVLVADKSTELTQKDAEVLLLKWTREKKIIRDIWI